MGKSPVSLPKQNRERGPMKQIVANFGLVLAFAIWVLGSRSRHRQCYQGLIIKAKIKAILKVTNFQDKY